MELFFATLCVAAVLVALFVPRPVYVLAVIFTVFGLTAVPKACSAQTMGLHLGSHHFPDEDYQNNSNLGLYVRFDNGLLLGGYRNTIHRNSFYVGYQRDWSWFGLAVGGITGYQHRKEEVPCTTAQVREVTVGANTPVDVRCYYETGASKTYIAPMISPSVRLPAILGTTPRLSYVPGILGAANVIHLSIERSF